MHRSGPRSILAVYPRKAWLTLSQSRQLSFFQKLKLTAELLDANPKEWSQREDYREALTIIKNIKVMNDYAECAVALTQEYNGLLTRDDKRQQQYPDFLKSTLAQQSKYK